MDISVTRMKAKRTPLVHKLQALLSHCQDIRHLAERAFATYVRSVQLMSNKEVFHFPSLPLDAFALSLGLSQAPAVDGGAPKKMSKLERLKAKIKAAKARKGRQPVEVENPKTKWERRQDAIQTKRKARIKDDDNFLVSALRRPLHKRDA